MKPIAIDLFCGLGGWAEGLIAAGWEVIGFDIERHVYGEHRYPAQLVLQDVHTIHGSQFRDAGLIVASPPCQEYSYMAMPFSRGKRIAAALRGEGEFPEGYTGSRTVADLRALFDACFRIQLEASEAAGRHIPLIVENVRGAQPWVGRAAWNYGSYYLWGDVPALMPFTGAAMKANPDGTAHGQGSWFAVADSDNRGAQKRPGRNFHGPERGESSPSFNGGAHETRGVKQDAVKHGGNGGSWFPIAHGKDSGKTYGTNPVRGALISEGIKQHGSGAAWFDKRDGHSHTRHLTNQREHDAVEGGSDWFSSGTGMSNARKFASALIAKIPFALSHYIGEVFHP